MFHFNDDCLNTFEYLNHALVTTPIIYSPNLELPFDMMTDASDKAVGVVLGQRVNKCPMVIYYASKILDSDQ